MNTKSVVFGVVALIVIVGAVSIFMNNSRAATSPVPAPIVQTSQEARSQTLATTSTIMATSTAPLMQSTSQPFTQYKYFSKAHEIFPTLAVDTKKAMGAFTYKQENLGDNIYRITLVNNAEGYNGQSVTVTSGQSVYFIEPALGDDGASEDSITTDDSLVAVDAQGSILK
jgi:hypothetical protein